MSALDASALAEKRLASWGGQRLSDAMHALRATVARLPECLPHEAFKQRRYCTAVGEALACRDEVEVLRRLCLQHDVTLPPQGAEDVSGYQSAKAHLRTKAHEMFCAAEGVEEHERRLAGGLADVRRFAPRVLAGCKDAALALRLRKQEESLKLKYACLRPAGVQEGAPSTKRDVSLTTVPRPLRRKAWRKLAAQWYARREAIDGVFDALLHTRQELAQALGYANYAEYMTAQRGATPWGGLGMPGRLASQFAPAVQCLHAARKETLGLARLRPFDMNTHRVCGTWPWALWRKRMRVLLGHGAPVFAQCFEQMNAEGLLAVREGCQGACFHLQHSRRPYVQFDDGVSPKAVMSAVHEIGHGIHILLATKQEMPFYRRVSPLSGELAALGVEMLCASHLDAFYDDARLGTWSARKHLEGVLSVFSTAHAVETFEKALYSQNPCAEERGRIFSAIMRDHLGLVDYDGYDDVLRTWYHRIAPVVFSPGYFYNYAVAQAGALAVWAQARTDPEAGECFVRFMELGASLPDQDLYKAAGAPPLAADMIGLCKALSGTIGDMYRQVPLL
jgi:oligoendopeptidase F